MDAHVHPQPLYLLLCAVAIFEASLFCLPPHSLHRAAAIALLAAVTYSFQLSLLEYFPNRAFLSITLGATWTTFLNAFEILIVSNVGPQDPGLQLANPGKPICQAFRAATLPFNWRRIGTKWQIKVPASTKDGSIPGRVRFLFRRLSLLTACYLFMDLSTAGPPPDPNMITREKQTISYLLAGTGATSEDVGFRVITTVIYLISAALGVIGLYNLLAVVAVLCGDQPQSWPPIWQGWPSQAYSVRRFWGVSSNYYHQGLRKALSGPADWIVDLVIPRGNLISRYSRLALAFFLSAILHHQAEGSETGQLIFFSSQALGIISEDIVFKLYSFSPIQLPRHIERALGYLWVLVWLVCLVPYWSYSTMRTIDDPVRDRATFGVFKKILSK
ncbi:cytochrome p450 monooxygenase [Trichoderma arundinaceum]|uniref:Cytochrome p450 monooxygenase n=1 Tax=Trichoderma arundinaceum TaxID=490622 RepID=A0A395NTT7_TRIAR|nr:cytochrome p450 monooxygenase [Trichoderma arundinaceum]